MSIGLFSQRLPRQTTGQQTVRPCNNVSSSPFPFIAALPAGRCSPPAHPCHVASNSPVYRGSATSPGRLVCSISNETLGLRPALFLSGLFQSEPEPMKVKPSFILVHSHISLYHCTFRVRLWECNMIWYYIIYCFIRLTKKNVCAILYKNISPKGSKIWTFI